MGAASADDKTSRLRQALAKLRDEMTGALDVFMRRGPLVRGSVYELRRKCGKTTCACASGKKLHACMAITWTDAGRKRLRSLPPKEEMELTRLTEDYRRFRRARARLVELHAKLLGVVDQLEAARCRKP
jgi:hypothetical protein